MTDPSSKRDQPPILNYRRPRYRKDSFKEALYWCLPWAGLSVKPSRSAWFGGALMIAALGIVIAMKVLDMTGLLNQQLMFGLLFTMFGLFMSAVFVLNRTVKKARQESWNEAHRWENKPDP